MVSHWSLRESKSPQISRTLLSILADLTNAVIWMVSTYLLLSKSSSPFANLRGLFQVHQLQLVSPSGSVAASALWQGPDIYPSFCLLLILLIGPPERQSPLFSRFSFYLFIFFIYLIFFFFCDYILVMFFFFLVIIVKLRLGDSFVSQNPRELFVSHSPVKIQVCCI